MTRGSKRTGILGRVGRALRSILPASESARSPATERFDAPELESAPVPMGVNELINEGLQQRQRWGTAAAVPLFEQAANLDPTSHLPFFMLGNAATELNELDRAVTYYERARDCAPNNHVIRYNLGLCQLWRGYLKPATAELAVACRLDPSYAPAQSGFIMALHNSDAVSPEEIFEAIRERSNRLSMQHPATPRPRAPERAKQERLRVGFVSGDFRTHSVAQFFEPILSARNRQAFEYLLYSNSPGRDSVTDRLRTCADNWRDVWHVTDNALIELIRTDRIDILVDLSGYTEFDRLSVFARRAAPVQVTYLGFPSSTGLTTMDYRITDAATDPHPFADDWHSETLLRLPDSQWCFRPFGTPPVPGPLPAGAAGFVTYGSFNNLTKASDTLLRCWIQILAKSPNSRLRLTRVRSPQRANEIVAMFVEAGVAAERIECVAYTTQVPYGLQFSGVDIALDHFPYNGVTTTCESLYCGVPVISLHGRNCVSRSGMSILKTIRLDDLVASTPDEYVEIAVGLATDLPRLEQMRAGLRARFEQSALRDETRFARNFEQLLQTAWRDYCATSARTH